MVLLHPVLVLITAANVYHISAKSVKYATTSTAAPTAVSLGLGCYEDGEPRDMGALDESGNGHTDFKFYPYTGSNKPETCISYCNGKGFKYAGVQYSTQCFCGNSYGRYGKSTNCSMPCSGDDSRTCGGAWANFIYKTGASEPLANNNVGTKSISDASTLSSATTAVTTATTTTATTETASATTTQSTATITTAAASTAAASTAATSTSAPTAASLALGCYGDGEPRDLGGMDGSGDPSYDWQFYPYTGSNTPETCISFCLAKGFSFAGVQYAMQCFCGNTYGKYGLSTNCNMPCTGDSSRTCGGGCANFIYATSRSSQ